jgi:hypothetical protein
MKKRRTVAWLLAVAVGLMLVPAVDAMASAKSEKKQNTRITKVVKATAKLAVKVAGVTSTVADHTKALTDLAAADTALSGRIKAIEDGVPQVLDGLTKLSTAATQLKDGLTAAGAGLTTLGDAYKAVEYGRAGVFTSGVAATTAAGGTVTSADIPDDGNPVTVDDNAIIVAGAPGALTIDVTAAIRSNESDGDDASKTAGQAGGFMYVVDLDTGIRVACTGAPNPPGIDGTPTGASIVTPSGTVTNLNLVNIPGGVLRTDQSKPDASSTSILSGGPCGFAAAAGHTYQVHYSVNFLDIPTSTTPGPKD